MMDTNNSYQSRNDLYMQRTASDGLEYNLKAEKQETERITAKVKQELLAKWKKSYANAKVFPAQIEAMHPEVVDFLLSFNLVSVYDNIAKQANLDENGRNVLPHIVWQAAKTKNWNEIEKELEKQMALSPNAKTLILQLLEQNILGKIRMLSEKPVMKKMSAENGQKKEVQIPLSQALSQFPDLGEQHVTNNPLKLRYFPTPARPSIKNWITDFHDNMGAGKHSAIDRGNYLFHGENGKKLTPIERQKLSIILKSLDEGTPLTIDGEKQIIIFTELLQNSDRADTENKEEIRNDQKSSVIDQSAVNNFSRTINREPLTMKNELPNVSREPRVMNHQPSPMNHEQNRQNDVFPKHVEKPQPVYSNQKPATSNQPFAKKDEEMKQPAAKSYQSPVADYRQGTISKQQMVDEIQQPKFEEPAAQPRAIFQKPKSEMEIEHENYFSSFASHANNIKFPSKESAGEKPSSESIKFSSPQEFPVEQKEAAVKKEEEPKIQPKKVVQPKPEPKKEEPEKSQTDSFFQSQIAHFPQQNKKVIQSRWQIKPSSYHEENDDVKNAGNIVDLRN